MDDFFKWARTEQLIRYALAWGGAWLIGSGMNDTVQMAVGGVMVLFGAVWWWFSEQNEV